MHTLIKRFSIAALCVAVGMSGLVLFLRAGRPPKADTSHLHSSHFDHSNCAQLLWGNPLPDITLIDPNGTTIDVQALSRTPKSLLLVRYLGYSCSHCIAQLTALNTHADTLKKLGVHVIAFSEDDSQKNLALMKKYNFDPDVITLASDKDNMAGKLLNANYKEPNGDETSLHAAIVVRHNTVMFAVMDTQPFMAIDSLIKESQRTEPLEVIPPKELPYQ